MAGSHYSGPVVSACGFCLGTKSSKVEIISSGGNISACGNVSITGTLGACGNTTLGGNLAVTGTLGACGNTTLGGTLTSVGNVSACGNVTVTGTLGACGNTTLGGTLLSHGNVTACGNVTVGGTLGVCGTTTLGGNLAVVGTLGASGNTTLGGTLTSKGNVTACGSVSVAGAITGRRTVTTLTGATSVTLTAADSGKVYLCNQSAGDVAVTLPGATSAAGSGCEYTFIAIGSSCNDILISPNKVDKIQGGIITAGATTVASMAGTDDYDLKGGTGVMSAGHYAKLVCDGSDGWYLVGAFGGWSDAGAT